MKEKGQQNTALANVSWKFLKNGSPVPRPPPSSKTPTSTKTKRDSSSGVEEKPAHVSGGRNARVSRRGSGLKIVSLNDALEKEKVEREEEQDLMNSVLELLTSPVSVKETTESESGQTTNNDNNDSTEDRDATATNVSDGCATKKRGLKGTKDVMNELAKCDEDMVAVVRALNLSALNTDDQRRLVTVMLEDLYSGKQAPPEVIDALLVDPDASIVQQLAGEEEKEADDGEDDIAFVTETRVEIDVMSDEGDDDGERGEKTKAGSGSVDDDRAPSDGRSLWSGSVGVRRFSELEGLDPIQEEDGQTSPSLSQGSRRRVPVSGPSGAAVSGVVYAGPSQAAANGPGIPISPRRASFWSMGSESLRKTALLSPRSSISDSQPPTPPRRRRKSSSLSMVSESSLPPVFEEAGSTDSEAGSGRRSGSGGRGRRRSVVKIVRGRAASTVEPRKTSVRPRAPSAVYRPRAQSTGATGGHGLRPGAPLGRDVVSKPDPRRPLARPGVNVNPKALDAVLGRVEKGAEVSPNVMSSASLAAVASRGNLPPLRGASSRRLLNVLQASNSFSSFGSRVSHMRSNSGSTAEVSSYGGSIGSLDEDFKGLMDSGIGTLKAAYADWVSELEEQSGLNKSRRGGKNSALGTSSDEQDALLAYDADRGNKGQSAVLTRPHRVVEVENPPLELLFSDHRIVAGIAQRTLNIISEEKEERPRWSFSTRHDPEPEPDRLYLSWNTMPSEAGRDKRGGGEEEGGDGNQAGSDAARQRSRYQRWQRGRWFSAVSKWDQLAKQAKTKLDDPSVSFDDEEELAKEKKQKEREEARRGSSGQLGPEYQERLQNVRGAVPELYAARVLRDHYDLRGERVPHFLEVVPKSEPPSRGTLKRFISAAVPISKMVGARRQARMKSGRTLTKGAKFTQSHVLGLSQDHVTALRLTADMAAEGRLKELEALIEGGAAAAAMGNPQVRRRLHMSPGKKTIGRVN